MSPVAFFRSMWWVATPRGPAKSEDPRDTRRWTPLLIGTGFSEADAIARAEKLGLLVTTGREKVAKIRRVK
jgi:hypothetical protein